MGPTTQRVLDETTVDPVDLRRTHFRDPDPLMGPVTGTKRDLRRGRGKGHDCEDVGE